MGLDVKDRKTLGQEARKAVPRSSHGDWVAASDRPDPVALISDQNADRVPWLVPIRHGRMRVSPFTFYRGAAKVMASDLATTPTSGLDVQLGGDAHLSNFGAYASPERSLVFDANDFDETLRGPWEWDLKRLAASFMIAGEHLGFRAKDCRAVTAEAVRGYREAIDQFSRMTNLELWYDHVTVEDLKQAGAADPKELATRLDRFQRKAQSKNSAQALRKLAVKVDGRYQIRTEPPVLFPLSALPGEYDLPVMEETARTGYEAYKATVQDDRRWLLDQYEIVDLGVKVVGVGSVGTRCFILLLQGRDQDDPFFLQIKEASESVLEPYLGAGPYPHHGQRVVEGQRMVQAQSDIFLGWATGREDRQFYVRQLRDWKGSAEVEGSTPNQLGFYARLCGLTLARGHARSGDSVALRAYVGKGDELDRALVAFSEAYADQNLSDYKAFQAAIADGRLEATDG